jgi:hypothetical protein
LQGATGLTGATGATGLQGATGVTGATGSLSATNASGTGFALVYNTAIGPNYFYNSSLTFQQSSVTVANALLPANGSVTFGSDTNPWGPAYFTQTGEVVSTIVGATGVVTHNWLTGSVFYHSSIASNFTTNITNLPSTNNRSYVVVLNLQQGATPYYTSTLQVNGAATTLRWLNATVPTPTANRFEIESLTLYRLNNAWLANGQYASFG